MPPMIPSRLFWIFLVLLTSGCAVPVANYAPRSVEISEPPLNSVSIAQIGDSIVRQGKHEEHEAIFVDADQSIHLYIVRRGHYYMFGQDGKGGFYRPMGEGARIDKVMAGAYEVSALQAYFAEPTLCIVTVINTTACSSQVSFQRTQRASASARSFQQTLIYSGRVANRVKIGYREFSNDIARPAFNNEVEYDLQEARTIGYKGARIEILEATNEYIKYKVLRNFNQAER
jgi:hypothetical protein